MTSGRKLFCASTVVVSGRPILSILWINCQTAINVESLPGDIPGVIRCKECKRCSNLIGLGYPSKGDVCFYSKPLPFVAYPTFLERGYSRSRGNVIDAYTQFCILK